MTNFHHDWVKIEVMLFCAVCILFSPTVHLTISSPLKDFLASQDISVAYFGLDWAHVFKEIERIQSTVDEMHKAQNHPTSSLFNLGESKKRHLLH